jgi:hypothetical protein
MHAQTGIGIRLHSSLMGEVCACAVSLLSIHSFLGLHDSLTYACLLDILAGAWDGFNNKMVEFVIQYNKRTSLEKHG